MSIDRISGGSPVDPGSLVDGVGGAEAAQGASGVAPGDAAVGAIGVQAKAEVQASEALGRLERGEIGLEQYLDVQVNQATAHLEGRLGASELDFVKVELKRQMESDPVFVELVRRATGRMPRATDE